MTTTETETPEMMKHPERHYDWWVIGILLLTLLGYAYLAYVGRKQTEEFAAQLKAAKDDIIAKVTEQREQRVVPIDQKVEQIETTADVAKSRADVAEESANKVKKKTEEIAKDTKHIKKTLKPLLDNPKGDKVVKKIVEEVAPLVPEGPPTPAPTSEPLTPLPTIEHHGLFDFLFRR